MKGQKMWLVIKNRETYKTLEFIALDKITRLWIDPEGEAIHISYGQDTGTTFKRESYIFDIVDTTAPVEMRVALQDKPEYIIGNMSPAKRAVPDTIDEGNNKAFTEESEHKPDMALTLGLEDQLKHTKNYLEQFIACCKGVKNPSFKMLGLIREAESFLKDPVDG